VAIVSGTWAIVPVKAFRESKSRLASVLKAEERAWLAEALFRRTIGVLDESGRFERVCVVSASKQVLVAAGEIGCLAVIEPPDAGLNGALESAASEVVANGAAGVLVIHADLPLLTREDLDALLDLDGIAARAAIAPDRHRTGTNALFLSPPRGVPYRFGRDSFSLHTEAARSRELAMVVVETPGLGLDIDEPEDLALVPNEALEALLRPSLEPA
jgi:2-phospho-L-lactate guanylyltransferase